jgi:hypothetical protein
VTVTLDTATNTSRPPATAATTRPANGITIASSYPVTRLPRTYPQQSNPDAAAGHKRRP